MMQPDVKDLDIIDVYQYDSMSLASRWAIQSGLILGLRPANERRRNKVTPSPIGWVQT